MIVKFLSFLNSLFMLLALSAVEQTIQDKTRFHYYDDSDDIKIEWKEMTEYRLGRSRIIYN